MSNDERFDGLFLTVAQQAQGIEPLLDSLFSFLRRKTDFFQGAPREKAESIVLEALRRQATLADREVIEKKQAAEREEKKKRERLEKKRKEEEAKAAAAAAAAAATAASLPSVPPAAGDDVIELSEDGSFDISTAPAKAAAGAVTPPPAPAPAPAPAPVAESAAAAGGAEGEEAKDEEDEDKGPPLVGNGATTDKYSWTQTLGDLSLNIFLPPGTKARNLEVVIKNTKLKAGIKGQPPIVDGDLHKRVVVEDSCWTVEDGDLVITLQKHNRQEWWKGVIVGDPEINTKKVQPENSKLNDLDADTRQTVEKMMFDQKQKALGLPTSEELQKQEMLKKFMAAHPEMDFSNAKFT